MAAKVFGDRKKELTDYEILPKVVRTGTPVQLQVRSLYSHRALADGTTCGVTVMPMEGFGQPWPERFSEPLPITAENGRLTIPYTFDAEQEYIVEIRTPLPEGIPEATRRAEQEKRTVCLRVYALDADLFDRMPWKGDLHMHSHHSDGRESPGFVAASCRKIGLDFMAVTDHGRYEPSIEAQENFADVPVDMLICRGEEVHPPENPVHMIHFGGGESINGWMRENPEAYQAEVDAYVESLVSGDSTGASNAPAIPGKAALLAVLADPVADPVLNRQIASCCWVFDKIRACGGLGIFCHPYWKVREGYHIAGALTSWMLTHQPYDAYEIIGGYFKHEVDSNTLQVARYHEERAKGRPIPIVGVSDAHGCANSDLFGWYYTIVWSPELSREAVSESIRQGWSVAVEVMEGESARAYGPFRLVKLALFLIREVFPLHDAVCEPEADAMFAHLRGEKDGKASLARLQGGVKTLYEKLWG